MLYQPHPFKQNHNLRLFLLSNKVHNMLITQQMFFFVTFIINAGIFLPRLGCCEVTIDRDWTIWWQETKEIQELCCAI